MLFKDTFFSISWDLGIRHRHFWQDFKSYNFITRHSQDTSKSHADGILWTPVTNLNVPRLKGNTIAHSWSNVNVYLLFISLAFIIRLAKWGWLKKLAPQWLPCQAPRIIGSVLGLVDPVSVYCDWERQKVWPATSLSVWQHITLSEQICPWGTQACCWVIKQPTKQTHKWQKTGYSFTLCSARNQKWAVGVDFHKSLYRISTQGLEGTSRLCTIKHPEDVRCNIT